MKFITLVTSLILLSSTLIGCSSTPDKTTSAYPASSGNNNSSSNKTTKTKLITQHREWSGTPYRFGGLSKRGIDCSGFVYLTYRDKFGINLPRSTALQSKQGTTISQQELSAGDLVFFKTGSSKRHVGIYLSNRRFLHASTSKGVTISSLDNVYWRGKYWKAKRI